MGTKDITGHKTIAADQHLYFPGGTAFYVHQADGGDTPSMDIFGTITVQGTTGSVTGITTDDASALVTINIHEGGAVSAFTNGGAASAVVAHCPMTFVNDGSLFAACNRAGATAFLSFSTGTDAANTGQVEAQCDNGAATAFALYGAGALLANSGDILVEGKFAVGVNGSDGLAFTNTGAMEIKGGVTGAVGVSYAGAGGVIDNQGTITVSDGNKSALRAGVDIHFEGDLTIHNSGTIRAADAILVDTGVVSNVTLDNSGRLSGVVRLGAGTDHVDNSGLIGRNVFLGAGDDSFSISGHGRVKGEVFAGDGADTLTGGHAADRLSGAKGDDHLQGGANADVLSGGDGADVFVYARLTDSDLAHTDLITDLDGGDLIDLSRIDADATAGGDQAFVLVSAFDGHAGELTLSYDAGTDETLIAGDVNGDGVADLAIHASGDVTGFAAFVL